MFLTLLLLAGDFYSACGVKKWRKLCLIETDDHHLILIFKSQTETGKKKDSLLPDAIDVADNLQYWPERQGNLSALRFSHIAALHSELVAVSTTGQLYQWRWADKDPYVHPEVDDQLSQ